MPQVTAPQPWECPSYVCPASKFLPISTPDSFRSFAYNSHRDLCVTALTLNLLCSTTFHGSHCLGTKTKLFRRPPGSCLLFLAMGSPGQEHSFPLRWGGCPFLRPPLHHSLPQDAPRPVGIPHLFPQPPIDLAVGEGLFPVGLPRAVPTTSGTGPGA